jgi:hypothetical protein
MQHLFPALSADLLSSCSTMGSSLSRVGKEAQYDKTMRLLHWINGSGMIALVLMVIRAQRLQKEIGEAPFFSGVVLERNPAG